MRSRALALSAVALALFVGLCDLVHAGRFVELDVRARHWFWPSGTWGTSQRLEDVVVELCQPGVMAIVFAVVAARVARRRRDPVPFLSALGLIAVAIGAVVIIKHALAVPDVHGSTAHLGGSFPSGHMVGVICFGGGMVLLRERPTWRAWTVVAALATLVAACLLLTSVHWVTDVVGGVLLATSLTAAAATSPWWASSRGPREDVPSPTARTRSSTARRRG